uniref:OSJNBa0073L13.11 protein n=1 Tax=Oryza sativa subsp. japonica TaxID=39947 RepID=Q7XSH7_ORYSJ|nr:OSJNBa0073L13.11 [Oryza sativa Japonica Group]
MALSTLLLPSSSSSSSKTATATDTSDRRRHHHHHNHTKRKKKPPPPPLSPTPRTPPPAGSGSHRAMAASSKKSTKQVVVAAKTTTGHRPKKAAAAPTTPSRGAPSASAAPVSSSWEQLKSLLSCRSATAAARVHDPAAPSSALSRLRSHGAGACGASLCAIRDVVDAASSASAASTAAASLDRDTTPLTRSSRRAHRAATSSSGGGGGHHASLRGLSGCYECRAINVEPMSRRYPRPRELCACSQCGEVFNKADSLEHHQAIRHAVKIGWQKYIKRYLCLAIFCMLAVASASPFVEVSELGPEDSGRNIVEIIFKSSWQKRDRPICQIDRILKVHNAARTVARFEAYRDAVRTRCRATAARAAADGNELLRFHPAALACPLGLNGATSLCDDDDACGVCAAIRHGFAPWAGAHPLGVRTTASSGRAHDCGAAAAAAQQAGGCRAMLVCRVIAGRVRRNDDDGGAEEEEGAFDSVAGDEAASSVYGNLEELFVANPRAILPCFVVIYRVVPE